MGSRHRNRVGGGLTSRSSTSSGRVKARTTRASTCSGGRATEGVLHRGNSEPVTRAQSAECRTRQDHETIAAESERARTAGSPLRGSGRTRRRGEMFLLPPVDFSSYEPEEDSKYYTTSKACRLARVFSDTSLIEPTWSSVSRSPWGMAARVCGGYGRRLVNGTNSKNAPEFMYSKKFEGYQNDKSWKVRPRPFAYHGEANTAVSFDTPKLFKGRHTQVYGQPIERILKPPLRKIILERQIIVEPEVPETDNLGRLEWDDLSITGSKMATRKHE